MTFKPYKSYNFKDKDPIIDRVRTMIQDQNASYKFLADESGVSRSTIYKMFEGETRFPRHATVAAIIGTLGMHFTISARGSTNVVSLRKKVK